MLSRSYIIIGLLLWIPVCLLSQIGLADVDCPSGPDTIVRTCLPLIPTEFKDFTSNRDEDRVFFESQLGGKINSSTNNVVIRVRDNSLAPFPESCTDRRIVRRTFEIYDGDPNDPTVQPVECVLIYRVDIPYTIRRAGPYPNDTISCSEDVIQIFNDYIINWGYIELDSCSSQAGDTRLVSMIPSVPDINYTCGDRFNPGNGFVRVQFNLKNPCGDSLIIAADFYVEDNDPPAFTSCPDDITLEIDDDNIEDKIADYLLLGEAEDVCNTATVFTDWDQSNFDPFSCEAQQVIPVVFIAEDDCGNQNRDCVSNIIVNNDLDLEFSCPPSDLILECKDGMDSLLVGNWVAEATALEFTGDVISRDQILNDIDTLWFEDQICSDVFPILFTVTDRCGTSASCTKSIIIEDTSLPEIITCPVDTIVNADTDSMLIKVDTWLSVFDAADLCSTSTILSSDFDEASLDFNCGDQIIPIRLLADDDCNPIDSLACVAQLTIVDNVVADFTIFPNDTTLECAIPFDSSVLFDWISSASASNNLEQDFNIFADIDPSDPQWTTCGSNIEIPISFNDQCGDRISRIATITIEDTTVPEIICPSDTTMIGEFQDLQTEITNWLGTVQASDNCEFQTPIWDYSSLRFDPCAERDSQLVTMFVSDNCSNVSDPCTTLLRIESQKQPVINCPETLEIECGADNGLDTIQSWLQTAIAEDFNGTLLNGQVTNSYVAQDIEMVSCFDTLTIEFQIINSCGYDKKCSALIKVEDTLNPNVSCPSTRTVNTTSPTILDDVNSWLESVTYDDHNCFTPIMTHTLMGYDTLDWCAQSGTINVQFNLEDPCENKGSCSSELTINNTNPIITCPPLLPLECGGADNYTDIISHINSTQAIDNNGEALVLNYDTNIDFDLSCVQEINIEVMVEDNCFNSSLCEVIISVEDTEQPTVDCPPTLSLLSGDPDKAPKFQSYVEAIQYDDCTMAELTTDFDTTLFNVDCVDQSYIVIVNVMDECGNVNSDCSFEINISNNVSTTFQNCDSSNDLIIECGDPDNEMILTDWFASINAVDNLGNEFPVSPDITTDDPRLRNCGIEVTVTFALVDFCNTSQTCNAIIFIEDNIDPEVQCPTDTTFMIGATDFNANVTAWLQSASATDNCDAMVDIVSDYTTVTAVPPCEEFEIVPVTFTATDDCNGTETCVSTLSVRTSVLPEISCPTMELILECGDPDNQNIIDQWLAQAAGIDADNNVLTVAEEYDVTLLSSIECNGIIPVTFSIEDNCGIKESCIQQIEVIDTQAPTLICPEDITISSTSQTGLVDIDDWIAALIVEDNCSLVDNGVVNTALLPLDLCDAQAITEIEFYAIDGCDTESSCISRLTINSDAPLLNCNSDLRIQCGVADNIDVVNDWVSAFTALDNNNVDLLIEDNIGQLDFGNVCEESIDVSFSVEDVCGNENSCSRKIIQVDTLAPEILSCPDDLDLDVSLTDLDSRVAQWLAIYQAEDNCTNAAIENDYSLMPAEFDCGQFQEVQFLAVDDCNNINSDCRATISFSNNLTVSITCPEPVSLVCNEPGLETAVLDFTNNYIPESIDDFTVESDLILSNLDLECVEPYTLMITLTLIDDCNNRDVCETSIDFLPAASVYIPNTFSPELTGDNSTFNVFPNVAVETITNMSIYDRWGEEMFVLRDFVPETTNGWDGRNKKGELVPGVYTYFIQYTDVFGNDIQKVGSITLIR